MLKLIGITKEYPLADEKVLALKGIDLEFREKEFVAILGHSGCGKTTMLNVIGGLDKYTDGDLIINGVSTKLFKDRDWDLYRNHSVGFIFQTYNLIMHLSVIENVELALTLVGIDRKERRERAKRALASVGLAGQEYKRPNQLSGGQMQRVAIARAIINDPDILLADEPTGALDSDTSVQIMEILKELAKDRLIIMVTHNPELAEEYGSRIVRVADGKIVSDSNPYDSSVEPAEAPEEEPVEEPAKTKAGVPKRDLHIFKSRRRKNHTSMSYKSALTLSGKNLLTKRARTTLTSIAGSIGIIGIAIVMALSSGFGSFVNVTAENTLSQYPLSIQASSLNLTTVLSSLMQVGVNPDELTKYPDVDDKATIGLNAMLSNLLTTEGLGSILSRNDLTSLKKYLDANFDKKLGTLEYNYGLDMHLYTNFSPDSTVDHDYYYKVNPFYARIDSQLGEVLGSLSDSGIMDSMGLGGLTDMISSAAGSYGSMIPVWDELSPNQELLESQYELLGAEEYGSRWPQNKNELVLVVDEYNNIDDLQAFTLGLVNPGALGDVFDLGGLLGGVGDNTDQTGALADRKFTFEELLNLEYKLLLSGDYYYFDETAGTWNIQRYQEVADDKVQAMVDLIDERATTLEVVGIIRRREGVDVGSINGVIAYTPELGQWMISAAYGSEVARAQNTAKIIYTDTKDRVVAEEYYLVNTDDVGNRTYGDKLATCTYFPVNEKLVPLANNPLAEPVWTYPEGATEESIHFVESVLVRGGTGFSLRVPLYNATGYSYFDKVNITDAKDAHSPSVTAKYHVVVGHDNAKYMMSNLKCNDDHTVTEKNYNAWMQALGCANVNAPSSISIYPQSFDAKDAIIELLKNYDREQQAIRDQKIADIQADPELTEAEKKAAIRSIEMSYSDLQYNDTIGVLMSSITTIIQAITYVLIAFSSISLVVSSIMISIITYTSVMERTKEIGILRSIGARKRDISRVFNSETFIIGALSGIIAVLFTLLLTLPVNAILLSYTGIPNLVTMLWWHPLLLIGLSVGLTFIAGLIPSRIAAAKDPVLALRSE